MKMINIKKISLLDMVFTGSVILIVILSFVKPPEVYQIYRLFKPLQGKLWEDKFFDVLTLDLTNLSLDILLFFTANYLIITFFGYLLTYNFFKGFGVLPLIQYIASFVLGYLCLIPIIRVVSFMFPYGYIYFPVISLVLVYCLYKHIQEPYKLKRLFQIQSNCEQKRDFYSLLALASMLFLSVMLLQIYQVDFKWFGHANVNPFLDKWRAERLNHFPVITQHYEDLIFHYFLTMSGKIDLPSVFPWWLSLGLLKVSMFMFFYALFRKLGAELYLAIASSIFLMIGTTSLIPTKYYLIFEYGNPAFFLAVSGRVIGIELLIFIVIYGAYENQNNRLSSVFFILVGAGLSAITMPNVFWVVIFYLLTIIFRNYHNIITSDHSRENLKVFDSAYGKVIVYGSFFVSLLLYGLPFDNTRWLPFNNTVYSMIRFRLVSALIILLFLYIFLKIFYIIKWQFAGSERLRFPARTFMALAMSSIVGIYFFGNVFAKNDLSAAFLDVVGRTFGQTAYDELQSTYVEFGSFILGDYRNLHSGTEYNKGIFQFASCYGGILFMILVSDYLFSKGRSLAGTTEYVLYMNFLAASVCMTILLWFTDFVGVMPVNTWNKTRFIELPVYYIVFYFLYSLNKYLKTKARLIAALLLLIYSITPFLATDRHRQIYANFQFFEKLIGVK